MSQWPAPSVDIDAGNTPTNPDIDTLLAERAQTHGDFATVCSISQAIKDLVRAQAGWGRLSDAQREALDMEATKNARILAGNPDEIDHWNDKAGYARLVANLVK